MLKFVGLMVVIYFAVTLSPTSYLAEQGAAALRGLIILILLYLGALFIYRAVRDNDEH